MRVFERIPKTVIWNALIPYKELDDRVTGSILMLINILLLINVLIASLMIPVVIAVALEVALEIELLFPFSTIIR